LERTVLSNVKVDHEKHFAFCLLVQSLFLRKMHGFISMLNPIRSRFDSPLNMLSKGFRKKSQNIAIDLKDPITPAYINQ
jgi:hypothetical protein